MEYVSLEGLRLDGRRPKETRRMRCEMSVLPNADGSAVFEAGNTKVLAAVYGPREAPMRSDALHDRTRRDRTGRHPPNRPEPKGEFTLHPIRAFSSKK